MSEAKNGYMICIDCGDGLNDEMHDRCIRCEAGFRHEYEDDEYGEEPQIPTDDDWAYL